MREERGLKAVKGVLEVRKKGEGSSATEGRCGGPNIDGKIFLWDYYVGRGRGGLRYCATPPDYPVNPVWKDYLSKDLSAITRDYVTTYIFSLSPGRSWTTEPEIY